MLDTRSQIVLSDHGGNNARRVRVFGVQASWELNAVGSLSCFARIADLRSAGVDTALSGKWLTCGVGVGDEWGGVVTARPVTPEVTEITAEGWATMLRGITIMQSISTGPLRGQYAGVARAGVIAALANQTFISIGSIDEGGELTEISEFGQDVIDDLAGSLTDNDRMEWYVDGDKRFHAGRRIGVDYSHKFQFIEGRHIVDFSGPIDDLWSKPAKQIMVLQSQESLIQSTITLGRSREKGGRSTQHQPRYGLRPGQFTNVPAGGHRGSEVVYDSGRNFNGMDTPGNDNAWGRAQPIPPSVPNPSTASLVPIAAPPPPASVPLEITLANVDNCYGWLNIGDSARVILGSVSLAGVFRVFVKSVDIDERVMILGGEIIPDIEGRIDK